MAFDTSIESWEEYDVPTVIRQGFVPEDFSEYDIPTFLRKPRKLYKDELESIIDELDMNIVWWNDKIAQEINGVIEILN